MDRQLFRVAAQRRGSHFSVLLNEFLGSFCMPFHLWVVARFFRSSERIFKLQAWSGFLASILRGHLPGLTAVVAVVVVVVIDVVLVVIAVIIFIEVVVVTRTAIAGTTTPPTLPGSNSSSNRPSCNLFMRVVCSIFVQIVLTRSMTMHVQKNASLKSVPDILQNAPELLLHHYSRFRTL